jgi:poly(3-hydroxybutyrate) depolymerase
MRGTDDQIYTDDTHPFIHPFAEQDYTILGLDDTLNFWLDRNGCDPAAVRSANGVLNARVYDVCDGGTQVALYNVLGGKVNWPRQGDYALNRFGIDATAMVMAFFAGDEAWAQTQLLFEEQARTYVVYVPSTYDPAEPMPLALLLHGRFGSGAGTAQYTRLNRVAEEHGFIAVYPDGLQNPGAELAVDTGWNYVRGTPFAPVQEPNDSAFLRDLIADLSIDLSIDQQRIYVAGFSNGGMMAHHLACNDPTQYAAFGTVAGSAYMGMETVCQQETPVSMIIIHGTYDDNIRWEGLQDIINNQLVYVIYPVGDVSVLGR